MDGCLGFRAIASRLQRLMRLKPKSQPQRRSLQISKPFDFKHNNVALPGVSEDEIAILKEKAAASRVGIAPDGQEKSRLEQPRRAPAPPSGRSQTPTMRI